MAKKKKVISEGTSSGMGMSKHRTSGKAVSAEHFTGKSGKKGTKRKRKSSRKERRSKRGGHESKY